MPYEKWVEPIVDPYPLFEISKRMKSPNEIAFLMGEVYDSHIEDMEEYLSHLKDHLESVKPWYGFLHYLVKQSVGLKPHLTTTGSDFQQTWFDCIEANPPKWTQQGEMTSLENSTLFTGNVNYDWHIQHFLKKLKFRTGAFVHSRTTRITIYMEVGKLVESITYLYPIGAKPSHVCDIFVRKNLRRK